jgi:hypothetical protein
VEESPDDDSRRDEEQAKDLIAAEGATLFLAALLFGELFVVRLDTAVDHRKGAEFTTDQYRGRGVFESLMTLKGRSSANAMTHPELMSGEILLPPNDS